jgi:branched-chain amino acid transport system ATP-binding protein
VGLPTHRIVHLGIGYCPEERGIFASLTVEENLLLPPPVARGGLSVEELHELFPNLAERRHSPGGRLSGGEQQMLALARILRTGARLLLLDEITEGLAPVVVQALGRAVATLRARGFTMVLVEQNFRFAAALADRHVLLENGHVVDTLARADLEARAGALQRFLGV